MTTVNASHRSRSLDAVGEAVRGYRDRQRLTITQIARGVCSPATWLRVEHGEEVEARTYRKIAPVLHIEPDLLINAARNIDFLPELLDALGAGPPWPPIRQLGTDDLLDFVLEGLDELRYRFDDLKRANEALAAHIAATDGATPRRPRATRADNPAEGDSDGHPHRARR